MTTAWTHTGFAQRIHFGLDTIDRAGEILKEAGGRRALLVTTAGRRESDSAERLIKALGRALVSVFDALT